MKNRKSVQTIFFEIRGYYEIQVFEQSKVDHTSLSYFLLDMPLKCI